MEQEEIERDFISVPAATSKLDDPLDILPDVRK